MKKTGEQIANEMDRATNRADFRKIAGEYAEERRQAVAEIRKKYENSASPIASAMLERAEEEEKRAKVLDAISNNDRKAYEEAAAGASGYLLQTFHGYAVRGLEDEEETTEQTEEPKTIAQRFAENRAEREKFEAFKAAYFEAHPSTAKRFKNYARGVETLNQIAKDVRRALEAVQRRDELAAVGPAGTSPNGLPMYWDHFDAIEAPEYLAKVEAEASDLSKYIAKTLEKIRKAYEAEQTAKEKATAEAKAVAAGTLMAVRNACKKYDKDAARIVVKASAEAFAEVLEEHAEKLQQLPEIAATYRAAADELAEMLKELDGVEQPAEQPAEETTEAAESTQSDRARSAYLNTCDECEAIEATGTREAMHEAKKLRTLAAEAYAHHLRTHAPEWVEELETLHREACAYSPDGLQNQRSGAEGIGYHPRE